jgi:mannose-1-phosphate guanylyltransferase
MRAVVLVGGFGTRLRPLTLHTPKPMLTVGHVPIIERLVRNLARGGITEVTLALGFRPEPFVVAFPDNRCAGVALRYAVEPEPLDTAGAIRFAAEHAGIDDTFVVANGDVLTDLDLDALVAFHRRSHAEATLHLTAVDDPSQFGVVAIDAAGRVERFVEKPAPGAAPSNYINAGTYVLEPSVLATIEIGRKVSIEREVFPLLVERGRVFAMPTDDYWVDTGTIELFRNANLEAVDGTRPTTSPAVAAGAHMHHTATVERSVVAKGCRVGEHVALVDSVLLGEAVVEDRAEIRRSVIMGTVREGATVVDSVLGADAEITAGEHVVGERRPAPEA